MVEQELKEIEQFVGKCFITFMSKCDRSYANQMFDMLQEKVDEYERLQKGGEN